MASKDTSDSSKNAPKNPKNQTGDHKDAEAKPPLEGGEQAAIDTQTALAGNSQGQPTVQVEAPAGQAPKSTPAAPAIHVATQREMVGLAILLTISTVIVLVFWFCSVDRLDGIILKQNKVDFTLSDSIRLKPGPPTFKYDRQAKALHHRGPITPKLKSELALLPEMVETEEKKALNTMSQAAPEIDHETRKARQQRHYNQGLRNYHGALDELAYLSNQSSTEVLVWLLFLGGLSGLLGAQLRSVSDFIGNSAYKNQLVIKRWWPLYAMRPMLGFLLGMVAVLLVMSNMLPTETRDPSSTSWWLAVTIIAGFGCFDFTTRLRLLSRTLFGSSDQSKNAGNAAGGKQPTG